jgi:hypothetical protein
MPPDTLYGTIDPDGDVDYHVLEENRGGFPVASLVQLGGNAAPAGSRSL